MRNASHQNGNTSLFGVMYIFIQWVLIKCYYIPVLWILHIPSHSIFTTNLLITGFYAHLRDERTEAKGDKISRSRSHRLWDRIPIQACSEFPRISQESGNLLQRSLLLLWVEIIDLLKNNSQGRGSGVSTNWHRAGWCGLEWPGINSADPSHWHPAFGSTCHNKFS